MVQIWIIGRDPYPYAVLFKASFSFRSGNIVKIGSELIVGIVMLKRFYIHERFDPPPQRFGDKIVQMWIIGRDSYTRSPLQGEFFSKIRPSC